MDLVAAPELIDSLQCSALEETCAVQFLCNLQNIDYICPRRT
jgi:hypothetical protein